jgi:hypothetical protein
MARPGAQIAPESFLVADFLMFSSYPDSETYQEHASGQTEAEIDTVITWEYKCKPLLRTAKPSPTRQIPIPTFTLGFIFSARRCGRF